MKVVVLSLHFLTVFRFLASHSFLHLSLDARIACALILAPSIFHCADERPFLADWAPVTFLSE